MDDTPPQIDLSTLAAKMAEIDQLREACVRAKAEAEAARDAATQAKAKAEAEANQVSKIIAATETARSSAEQERDKAAAAGTAATSATTTIDEQKNKISAAVTAIEAEQKKAQTASTAATLASDAAEKSKSAAETAKLEAETQRTNATESAKAVAEVKAAVDTAQTAVAKRTAQIEAAKAAAMAAQTAAEAASTAANTARLSCETELESAKKASTDADLTAREAIKLCENVDQIKASVLKDQVHVQAVVKDAERVSTVAAQSAKNAADALNLGTTVSLAGAFNKKAGKNTWREWIWAGTLLASLIGILLMGIWRYEGLSEAISKSTDTRTLLAEILLAFFGVSGPLWLAWISTRMLGRTFALVEDYSYKSALAQAYVGFRQEAKDLDPIFQERLFAAAITQLDANPVRLLHAEHPGSPLQDLMQQRFMQDAMENPTFAQFMTLWWRKIFRARVPELPKAEGAAKAAE